MKVQLNATAVLALVGVAVAGYAAWRIAQAAPDAIAAAAEKLDPTNPNNVVNSVVTAGVSAVAGRPETLGGVIRSATSNDDARIEAMLRGEPIPEEKSLFKPSTWFN